MKRSQPDSLTDSATEANTTRFSYTPREENVPVDVVEAVASVADVDPVDFEPRLNEAVDPDALARCVTSGESVRVSFELGHYDVTITGGGTIVVAE